MVQDCLRADEAAHRIAVEHNMKTIGVLAFGITRIIQNYCGHSKEMEQDHIPVKNIRQYAGK